MGVLVRYPVSRRSVRPLADEATRLLPGDELVQVGDIFPMTQKAQDRFVVRVAGPARALVLSDNASQMSRQLALEPAGETSTRLTTRSRRGVFWLPFDCGMQRRQTVGRKRTVETA